MILTDREIQIAISKKLIKIFPEPAVGAYSSTSVDLRLDENLVVFRDPKTFLPTSIDPTDINYDHNTALSSIADKVVISQSDGYKLPPGKLILGWTIEEVVLPMESRVAARVEGKSSLARLGLCVHLTAPTIHAGFPGQIQLEIINHGPLPIILRTGMRICQLIFETTLGTPDKGYRGQFAGQTAT